MIRYKTYSYTDKEKLLLNVLINDSDLISEIESVPYFRVSPQTVIRLLFNRGIRTADDIRYMLFGSSGDYYDIPFRGQSLFEARLEQAYDNREVIVVMGDYDTDGTMATGVMVKALRAMGFRVMYHMNSRFVEGYGLKVSTVDEILKMYANTKVIITVDNGIKSHEAIDYCNSLGIDVLVTDHHEPGETLPNAYAVVDPKQVGCMYPFKDLCGAGIAFKLMRSYVRKHFVYDFDIVGQVDDLVWIAGIATIGDSVPLVMENRIIVKKCLNYLSGLMGEIKFLEAIKKVLGHPVISVDTVAYYISPMINAMGRLEGNPIQVVEALIHPDPDIVEGIALHMDDLNKKRREMTDTQVEKAYSYIGENPGKFIVVYDSSFSEGIIGIIASRISEKFHRPSLVLCSTESGDVKGSARGIPGFSVIDSLDSVSDLLVAYGGHVPAAGLTTKFEYIDELATRLNQYCESLDDSIFDKVIEIDIVVNKSMLIEEFCQLLDYLGPYGKGFERPVVMLKDFVVDKDKSLRNKYKSFYVGENGKTLRLVDSDWMSVIGFKASDKYKDIGEPSKISVVGYPNVNEYNGSRSVQFLVDKDYIIKSKE